MWAQYVSQPPIERGQGQSGGPEPTEPKHAASGETLVDHGRTRVRSLLLDCCEDDWDARGFASAGYLQRRRHCRLDVDSSCTLGARPPLMMSNYPHAPSAQTAPSDSSVTRPSHIFPLVSGELAIWSG
jgi:hypothetical protein